MKKEVIVQKNPKSPTAEVFRTLRTNIQFMNSKKTLKSLLITSTFPSEGKSWTSANLAVTFAKAGKKVILIDADMRKGRQHSIFGLENILGLSNYLSGIDENGKNENVNVTKYIQRTEVPNLFLMPRGNTPPNPSELLASDAMLKMIADLEELFDLIIFDGAPSLIVTDSIIISRLVDTTIIVTKYNETKKDNLAKVKRDIENVGGKIAGVVINQIPRQGKQYETTYYYSSEDANVYNRENRRLDEYEEFARQKQSEINYNNVDVSKNANINMEKKQEILDQINQYLNKDKK